MPAFPDNQPIASSVSDRLASTHAAPGRANAQRQAMPSEKAEANDQRVRQALRVLDQDIEWASDLALNTGLTD
jgi:hypothetical protein